MSSALMGEKILYFIPSKYTNISRGSLTVPTIKIHGCIALPALYFRFNISSISTVVGATTIKLFCESWIEYFMMVFLPSEFVIDFLFVGTKIACRRYRIIQHLEPKK